MAFKEKIVVAERFRNDVFNGVERARSIAEKANHRSMVLEKGGRIAVAVGGTKNRLAR